MEIKFVKNENLRDREATLQTDLPFGRHFTDYMLIWDYTPESGWHNARITPYAPLQLDPASSCLHYGQLFFEGMKAYRHADGKIALFRPMENMTRLNKSAWRMSMPEIDPEKALNSIIELLNVEKDWVPSSPESSLYIRPFMIATDPFIGLRPSANYQFIVILSPVGPYYGNDGLAPVRIFVEEKFVRAVKGGTGYAKCAGNYAASMRSQVKAAEKGYNQVLWLDGIERKYVEEVGAMNVFFVIDGKVVTPELGGTILPGITRLSVLDILRDRGIPVEERPIAIDEIADAYKQGTLEEAFGSGTAAIVAPIGSLVWGKVQMRLSNGGVGKITKDVYDELTGIQYGTRPDTKGWTKIIC